MQRLLGQRPHSSYPRTLTLFSSGSMSAGPVLFPHTLCGKHFLFTMEESDTGKEGMPARKFPRSSLSLKMQTASKGLEEPVSETQ